MQGRKMTNYDPDEIYDLITSFESSGGSRKRKGCCQSVERVVGVELNLGLRPLLVHKTREIPFSARGSPILDLPSVLEHSLGMQLIHQDNVRVQSLQ